MYAALAIARTSSKETCLAACAVRQTTLDRKTLKNEYALREVAAQVAVVS